MTFDAYFARSKVFFFFPFERKREKKPFSFPYHETERRTSVLEDLIFRERERFFSIEHPYDAQGYTVNRLTVPPRRGRCNRIQIRDSYLSTK